MWPEIWLVFFGCMALGFGALFVLTLMAKQVRDERRHCGKDT